jgi:hypothetical protein
VFLKYNPVPPPPAVLLYNIVCAVAVGSLAIDENESVSLITTLPVPLAFNIRSSLLLKPNIDSGSATISGLRSNEDLILKASGTGNVVIDDTLTFSAMATDPTATAQTTLYNKTAGGGGTGLYFRNTAIGSGAVGELISKKKATALAIALG